MRQAVEVRTYPLTLVLERAPLSFGSPLPREFPQPQRSPFPAPVPFAVCSDYRSTKGMSVSTVSAVFAPAVRPHSGCFIQKTWTDSPGLTPVCFSFGLGEQTLTYFLCWGSWNWEENMNSVDTCVCLHVHLFSPQRWQREICILKLSSVRQACDILHKTRIRCSKLSGEFTREPGLNRKALFSYSAGPDHRLVILSRGRERSDALFKRLAVVRTFCLFLRQPLLAGSSIQRKVTNIHRISHFGKAPNEATSHGSSNCHYYCIR